MNTPMTAPSFHVADWRDAVVYSDKGPQPQFLADGPQIKVILAGLEAGHRLPVHPEEQAVYHFLQGTGAMTVGEETITVQPGAIVIVPAGASRGIVAETRLAFLAVKA